MASKTKSAPRKKATAAAAPARVPPTRINPAVIVAARNIINMAVVTASSATVLLTLMIARQF